MNLIRIRLLCLLILCPTLPVGCASINDSRRTQQKSFSLRQLTQTPFRSLTKPGPYKYTSLSDYKIRISPKEFINTDVYLAQHKSKAPLAIIQHGNLAGKEFHSKQGRWLASWGIHAIVVEQPNKKRWIQNGHTLARLVKLLHKWPKMLGNQFDRNQIVLIGHSFGGSAISIAAGKGAPASGLIMLDPALFSSKVKPYIRSIKVPTIILGADRRVFNSRKRATFFKLIKNDVLEISVARATHNDAQYPHMFKWKEWFGVAKSPNETLQKRFSAALTASVISIFEKWSFIDSNVTPFPNGSIS